MSRITRALSLTAFMAVALPAAAQQPDWRNRDALVEAAISSNPSIGRLQAEVNAARERIAPAGAQPNPMVMGGVQDKMVTFEDDEMMTMYMVGASQSFTRGSKLDARRKAARLEAEALEQQLDSLRAEIRRDVLLAWLDIAAADSQAATTEEVRHLIDAVIAAARVRYEVGGAAQADIVRAQLQASDLDHQLFALRGRRNAAVARLLALVGAPQTTEIPQLSLTAAQTTPPAGLAVSDDHPAIAALRTEVERQDALIEAARLETKPDFGVEASYGYRPEQTDMFSVVATVELPIRRKTVIEPRVREAIAQREAARLRIEELRRQLAQSLGVAAAAYNESIQQLKLHDEVLVPQAKLAFESTLAAYQSGRAPFDAILATETAYVRLQLQYFDFLSRVQQAAADYLALQQGARSGALGGTAMPTAIASATAPATSSMNGM